MVDLAIPADYRVNMKEIEKIDKYFDFAMELKKKLLNMRVTVTPIVVSALWMVPKGLERRLEELDIRGRTDAILTAALLKSASIIRKVQEIYKDLLSLRLPWKTAVNHHAERYQSDPSMACESPPHEDRFHMYVSLVFECSYWKEKYAHQGCRGYDPTKKAPHALGTGKEVWPADLWNNVAVVSKSEWRGKESKTVARNNLH